MKLKLVTHRRTLISMASKTAWLIFCEQVLYLWFLFFRIQSTETSQACFRLPHNDDDDDHDFISFMMMMINVLCHCHLPGHPAVKILQSAVQYIHTGSVFTAHMHFARSWDRMSSVCLSVCPSVCNVGGLWSHRLEILKTNCTDN